MTQSTSNDVKAAHAKTDKRARAWARQGDGFMTESSHMTNHVERWAQRRRTDRGEMRSGLKNLALLNMDVVFREDVN